jgi:hypothetical protein
MIKTNVLREQILKILQDESASISDIVESLLAKNG